MIADGPSNGRILTRAKSRGQQTRLDEHDEDDKDDDDDNDQHDDVYDDDCNDDERSTKAALILTGVSLKEPYYE
ncbi:hypothetical protein PoB_007454500 [Plakobranchus ocellatus]|uniref:Uncharacterized protein n=1 Tax=Plakobranchus ocellatus TaxID=259542 RepID=A0AAV4DV60_9GAST|nr:hypothetical protein PoB_007454500 [Plakobranchus ocellatus]